MMSEPRSRRWALPEGTCPEEWRALGTELEIPGPAQDVLWNRGLRTRDDVRRFLKPEASHLLDPFLLTGMEEGVDRLARAIRSGRKILAFGDYDVDGITASVLWTCVLRHLGAKVEPMAPNRMENGFGLTVSVVERARDEGIGLLIASDCGSTAHLAIARAREIGLEILVADHHVPGKVLPGSCVLINPHRPGEESPFSDLAAVGVAFKILQALVGRVGGSAEREFLLRQCDLVALGTVADLVPLRGENRVLVAIGLERMRSDPRPALQALQEQAGLTSRMLDESHVAHFIAPRLNASGRLGTPRRTLDLLLAETLEEAREISEAIEEDNRERRRLNQRVLDDALRTIEGAAAGDPPALLVLGSAHWHPGVLGIAASRLAERFRVPAVLVAVGEGLARGSGRAPAGVDLLHLVGSASEHLLAFGGHPQAVGFSLRPERFEQFRSCLLASAQTFPWQAREDVLDLDGILDPSECDLPLVRWLDRLAPFGLGNGEPLFQGSGICRGARVQQGRHLRMRIGTGRKGVDCIGFGMGSRVDEIPTGGALLDLAFHPTLNHYRGGERVQLKLREFRLRTTSNAG